MHTLTLNDHWVTQIRQMRAAITMPSIALRTPAIPYLICKPGAGTFDARVELDKRVGVTMTFRQSDLYVTAIDGKAVIQPKGTGDGDNGQMYSMDFSRYWTSLNRSGLESAVRDMHKSVGKDMNKARELVIMCVAESLRSDAVGGEIESVMKDWGGTEEQSQARHGRITTQLGFWGQASGEIYLGLSEKAKTILQTPLEKRSAAAKAHREPATFSQMDATVEQVAKGIDILRPFSLKDLTRTGRR